MRKMGVEGNMNKSSSCLKYNVLTITTDNRGIMDIFPFCAWILSVVSIATREAKVTVIYVQHEKKMMSQN